MSMKKCDYCGEEYDETLETTLETDVLRALNAWRKKNKRSNKRNTQEVMIERGYDNV